MAKMTPAELTAKHAARVSASVPYVQKGVENVTEAPGKKAAAAAEKAKANFVKAIDSGKFAARVGSVPLEEWKRATLAKVDRIPTGVEAAAEKIENFYSQLLPFQDKVAAEVRAMPDLTPSQRDQRVLAMVHGMRKFSFKR